MAATSPKLIASVRAKDETAELKLDVNLNTTLGEMLRYWTWRETSDKPVEGFLIDLSLLRAAASQVIGPAAAEPGLLSDADSIYSSLPVKRPRKSDKKAATPSQAINPFKKSASNNDRESPRVSRKGKEKAGPESQLAITSNLSAASATTHAAAASTPRRNTKRSGTAATESPNTRSETIPDIVQVNGWESGTVDPGGKGFHVGFCVYTDARLEVYFYVQPETRAGALCRAACAAVGVEFSSLRFSFAMRGERLRLQDEEWEERTDLLIRDRAAIGQTVESWGVEEGDLIDILSCQCGY